MKFLFSGDCYTAKADELISRLVNKVWPKTADGKPSTDEMDILRQLLTHKSFALCINAFRTYDVLMLHLMYLLL